MKVIKKYKLVQVSHNDLNGDRTVSLDMPDSSLYSYYDSEEEAIEYAFSKDSYADWAIIPIITFDNY